MKRLHRPCPHCRAAAGRWQITIACTCDPGAPPGKLTPMGPRWWRWFGVYADRIDRPDGQKEGTMCEPKATWASAVSDVGASVGGAARGALAVIFVSVASGIVITAAIHGALAAGNIISTVAPIFVSLVLLASVLTAVFMRRYLKRNPMLRTGPGWNALDDKAMATGRKAIEGAAAEQPAIEAPKPRLRPGTLAEPEFQFAMAGEVPLDADIVEAELVD